jgi:hypothetical protein
MDPVAKIILQTDVEEVYVIRSMSNITSTSIRSSETMAWTIQEALKRQGKCSREDWLTQLDRVHRSMSGQLPKKMSLGACSVTKA